MSVGPPFCSPAAAACLACAPPTLPLTVIAPSAQVPVQTTVLSTPYNLSLPSNLPLTFHPPPFFNTPTSLLQDFKDFFANPANVGRVYSPQSGARVVETHAVMIFGYDLKQGYWEVRGVEGGEGGNTRGCEGGAVQMTRQTS